MNRCFSLRRLSTLFPFLLLLGSGVAQAQNYEDQAKSILSLFEAGQKDTAYLLIEPLKREGRFVPAVLYTRAQMTPDDRALGLYKEILALDPSGAYGDKAALQLVSRYADKRDSLATAVWMGVLRTNYPRSPLVQQGDDIVAGVASWAAPEDDKPVASEGKGGEAKGGDAKGKGKGKGETSEGSGMRGYALQVGLFPTRESADARAAQLRARNLKAVTLPKVIEGKKNYALVVGPFATIEEANRKKPGIAAICDCKAFVVKVE